MAALQEGLAQRVVCVWRARRSAPSLSFWFSFAFSRSAAASACGGQEATHVTERSQLEGGEHLTSPGPHARRR